MSAPKRRSFALENQALVIVAAIAVIWLVVVLGVASSSGPFGIFVIIPIAVLAYFAFAVVRDRMSNREDDYYDRIER